MQTIGKADVYKWQQLTEEERKLDTDISFEKMFKFEDDK